MVQSGGHQNTACWRDSGPVPRGAVLGRGQLGAAIEKWARPMKFASSVQAAKIQRRLPKKLVAHFWALATRIGLILTPNSHAVRSFSTRIWCRTPVKGTGIWWKFDPKAARICISESGTKANFTGRAHFSILPRPRPMHACFPTAAAGRFAWARTIFLLA